MTSPATPATTPEIPADPARLTLPPEQFYWAILDGSVLPGHPAGRKRRLGYLFEAVLPLPIDDIHAVYRKLPEQKYLACGMARSQLSGNGQPSPLDLTSAITLSPTALPECIVAEVDPATLNLLEGEYEPESCRTIRIRCTRRLLAVFILCALLLTMGLENRVRSINQQRLIATQQQSDLYAQVLGPNYAASTQPPTLQITGELRRLQQTRNSSHAGDILIEISPLLADLFALWPRPTNAKPELHLQTDSLLITPEVITLRGSLQTTDEAQTLADALKNLPGWRLEPPNISTHQNRVNATIRLTRGLGATEP